jgi:hypothetical protein
MPRDDDTFTCPNCGADVPRRASACPECGSDANTGWSDNTIYDGLDLDDPDEFDYDDWLRREQGRPPAAEARWRSRAALIGWILLALLLFLFLRS